MPWDFLLNLKSDFCFDKRISLPNVRHIFSLRFVIPNTKSFYIFTTSDQTI